MGMPVFPPFPVQRHSRHIGCEYTSKIDSVQIDMSSRFNILDEKRMRIIREIAHANGLKAMSLLAWVVVAMGRAYQTRRWHKTTTQIQLRRRWIAGV
ncbi:hypothetical protein Hgul01_04230 [Herpetosiphon gulosus]|uniref:Uncharacterized protein n=1 Tax=Herpetosiphon gulosus TaxID=1973496 RepID=A0ABP9X7L9_9CHLR